MERRLFFRRAQVEGLDPSLALAFYCRTRADFLDLCDRAAAVPGPGEPAAVHVVPAGADAGGAAGPSAYLGGFDDDDDDDDDAAATADDEDDWEVV